MNYIPQVAKMLGVEMGERFKVTGHPIDTVYFFKDDGLHYTAAEGQNCDASMRKLLNGKYEIKKLPWKPKEGDRYFMPGVFGGLAVVEDATWGENKADIEIEEIHFNNGLICRTKEEAIEKAKKMLAAVKDDE